jgi:hypothetical protein
MPVGSGNWYYGNKGIGVRKTLVPMNPPHPFVFEDFLVDVLADSPYVTVTQSGTATTAAAISATAGDPVAQFGGWLAGATDDVDAEIDEIAIGGLGTGAGTPWMRADQVGKGALIAEWAFSVPTALTARQYFAGLSDDPVEGTATNGPLNIQTGYTLVDVADDAAGFVFSSLASTPTVWKKAATIAGTGSTITVADDTLTQVANTWTGLRVEVDLSGDVFYYSRAARGGPLTAYGHAADDVVTATVALLPVFTAAPTTTTAVPWEIDYCFAIAAIL